MAQKTIKDYEKRTLSDGTVQEGRIVERDDGKKVFLVGKTTRPGGNGGGGGSGNPTDYLSPSEAISYAKLLGEGAAAGFGPTQEDIDKERERLKGYYKPYFDVYRDQLNTQKDIAKQETDILRTRIKDNYEDSLDAVRESYNRRGLFFSGQELKEETRLARDKSQGLTSADLALQKTIGDIATRNADLTLKEQQAVEADLASYIESAGKQAESRGKAVAAEIATSLLEGIGTRIANEKAFNQAKDLEGLRLRQESAKRDVARLTGIFRGEPTYSFEFAANRESRAEQYFPYQIAQAEANIARSYYSGGGGGGNDPYGRYPNITSDVAERYRLPYNTPRAEYDTVLNVLYSAGDWGDAAWTLENKYGIDPSKFDNVLTEFYTGQTRIQLNKEGSSSNPFD